MRRGLPWPWPPLIAADGRDFGGSERRTPLFGHVDQCLEPMAESGDTEKEHSTMSSSDAHASHEANVPHQRNLDHYLAAVIDDEHGADAAARALQDAGFARRDISVYHGSEGAKAIAAQERSERPLAKLLRALMDIEEGVVRQDYLEALGHGASVVILHLPDPQ